MGDGRIHKNGVYKGVTDQRRLRGKELWEKLDDRILSKEGKALVTADPNLTPVTLNRLFQLQGGKLTDICTFFGEAPPASEEGEKEPKTAREAKLEKSDVGLAMLSCCIKDNLDATWAEICARYAATRRLPFLEIAIKLKELDKTHELRYYDDESKEPVIWHPKRASGPRRDLALKRVTNISDDWDEISGPILKGGKT